MQVEKYNPNSLSVSVARPRVQGRPDYQRCIGLYISRNSELREARGREAYEYYVAAGSSDPGKVLEEDKQVGCGVITGGYRMALQNCSIWNMKTYVGEYCPFMSKRLKRLVIGKLHFPR